MCSKVDLKNYRKAQAATLPESPRLIETWTQPIFMKLSVKIYTVGGSAAQAHCPDRRGGARGGGARGQRAAAGAGAAAPGARGGQPGEDREGLSFFHRLSLLSCTYFFLHAVCPAEMMLRGLEGWVVRSRKLERGSSFFYPLLLPSFHPSVVLPLT
jgi:hypothetical protein